VNERARYFRLGIFVLVGLGLFLLALIMFGGSRFFEEGVMMETYLDESVQGLDIGAPVKHRGVQIGFVREITFVRDVYPLPPDGEEWLRLGRYVLIRARLTRELEQTIAVEDRQMSIDRMIAAGLRARLAAQGLTGTAYLEIDFVDPSRNPPLRIAWKPSTLYVPSAQSAIKSLSNAAERVFGRLDDLDIESVVANLDRALISVRTAVDDARVNRLSEEAEKLLADVRKTSESVREAAKTVDLRPTQQRLEAALAELEGTLRTVDAFVGSGRGQVDELLQNLTEASENLRALTEDAKAYPSVILFGQPPPPWAPPEETR
jgi:phospholipid/cholesterol/gamma-HCH transport system substrate-binding protein/paraquat-inducible protein B